MQTPLETRSGITDKKQGSTHNPISRKFSHKDRRTLNYQAAIRMFERYKFGTEGKKEKHRTKPLQYLRNLKNLAIEQVRKNPTPFSRKQSD